MTACVALLRAVNVGGTGKLPIARLVEMCEAAGFEEARTYIASGNVVFSSRLKERGVKVAIFLHSVPPARALESESGRTMERLALGAREIYIADADVMARSKLMVPAAREGTARNMNTVARLAAMACAI